MSPKDSTLGKGYSYLFAIAISLLLVSGSVDFSIKFNDGKININFATRELSPHIFYPATMLIAGLLGLPTDGIANLIAKILKGQQ